MNQPAQIPDSQTRARSVSKWREVNQQIDLLTRSLDELIAILETGWRSQYLGLKYKDQGYFGGSRRKRRAKHSGIRLTVLLFNCRPNASPLQGKLLSFAIGSDAIAPSIPKNSIPEVNQ